MKLLFGGLVGLAIVLFASCSATRSGQVRIRGALSRMRTAGRVTYTGYVVNVSGPGISPTVGAAGLGQFAPDCVEVGVSSNVLSYETISTVGALLRVASGPRRKIQIFGVSSSLGDGVLDKPVTALFEKGRVPQLYSLVAREGVDVFSDRKIELSASASGSAEKPVDVLRSCFASALPVENLPAESISGVRLAVVTQNNINGLNNVKFDTATGDFTLVESLNLTELGAFAASSPDQTSLLVWDAGTGTSATFALLNNGHFDPQGGNLGDGLHLANSVAFKGDGQFAIASRQNFDLGVLKFQSGNYVTNSPSTVSFSPDRQILTYGDLLFRIGVLNSSVIVEQATMTSAFFSIGLANTTQRFLVFSTSDTSVFSILNSRGIYLSYVGAKPYVRFLKYVNAFGSLATTGTVQEAGTDLSVNLQRVSPDGKYLFVRVFDGSLKIRSYELDPDGGLPLNYSDEIDGTNSVDFAVDPLSRYLIVATDLSNVTFLRSYQIKPGGTLPPAHTFSVGLNGNVRRVIAYPVR